MQWDRVDDPTAGGSWAMVADADEAAGVIRGLDASAWQRARSELQGRGSVTPCLDGPEPRGKPLNAYPGGISPRLTEHFRSAP